MDWDATVAHPSPPPEISIVVPAYNEEENLVPLTSAIPQSLAGHGRPNENRFVDY
jgi:hypothetical protein